MALEDLFGSPDYLRQLIGEEQFDRAKQSALNQGIINASLQLLAGTPPSFDNRVQLVDCWLKLVKQVYKLIKQEWINSCEILLLLFSYKI